MKSWRYCTLTLHLSNSFWRLVRLDSPCLASLYRLNDTFNKDSDWVVRLSLLSPFKILSPTKLKKNVQKGLVVQHVYSAVNMNFFSCLNSKVINSLQRGLVSSVPLTFLFYFGNIDMLYCVQNQILKVYRIE